MVQRENGPVASDADVLYEPQAVLAGALDAYVCITADGRVVAWNPAAEQTFGWTNADACGRRIEELVIPARYRVAHRAGLGRVSAGGPGRVLGQRLQLKASHRDGHEFPVEMTLTVTNTPGGRRFHAFCHDVTVRDRASRFAAVETAVSQGLAQAPYSTVAAQRTVAALGLTMGWPVVELWLVDDARQLLVCAARHVAAGRDMRDFAVDELEYGVGLPGVVCREAGPHWIPNLAAETRYLRSRAAARNALHVAVGVPISSGGQVLGALCVYGDRVEDPEDSLIALLSGIAAHVGQYLERRRAEELEIELARTKDEFLSLVTHELRNPLAVITSTAALFDADLDAVSSTEQRQYLRTIGRSAERLSVMVSDLLDLAGLESGHLAIHPTSTDLVEIIDQAVQAITPAPAGRQLTIVVDVPERLELHADPDRLRQVADNLLSNAAKYTPVGGQITITARPDREDWIAWTVSDTGIGIPPAERPRLFRRFYRASTALQRHIPGTGLGLVITRTIIERHHGTITLADHDGPGTTLVVRLPTKPPKTSPSGNTGPEMTDPTA